MRVILSVDIELADAGVRQWADEFGLDPTQAAVKKDIALYVETLLRDCAGADTAAWTVDVTA